MKKNRRGVLVVSRDLFAEIFEYLLKEKISGTERFTIVNMKKIKYSNNLEVEIDFEGKAGAPMNKKGRFVLGEFRGRHEVPPSEAFKRSRKIGKKIEEIDPKLIPVKLANASDSGKNRIIGVAVEDCKRGDMVSIATNGDISDVNISDKALPVAEIINMARGERKFTKPKKKKIKKDSNIKSFDYADEIPF